ncbi:MAG: hypothetical protein LUE24_02815 [Lachnospiraceae bacterium]|nr:hypothetical protein [Lachnospiraceae bacterium]
MTHKEIIALVAEIGIPYAYHHFAEGESPDPPFICFLYPNAVQFGADNIVYHSDTAVDIELYTDEKNPEYEEAVEAVLTAHEIYFEKSEVWIDDEKLYEVLYSIVV